MAPKIDLRGCHSGRGMEHVGSTHQQIEVVVDEFPVLQGRRMWCKGAEHRAGVAGEIDDRERGHTAKADGNGGRNFGSRAHCEVRGENKSAENRSFCCRLDCAREKCSGVAPSREMHCGNTRGRGNLLTFVAVGDQPAKSVCECRGIVGFH